MATTANGSTGSIPVDSKPKLHHQRRRQYFGGTRRNNSLRWRQLQKQASLQREREHGHSGYGANPNCRIDDDHPRTTTVQRHNCYPRTVAFWFAVNKEAQNHRRSYLSGSQQRLRSCDLREGDAAQPGRSLIGRCGHLSSPRVNG